MVADVAAMAGAAGGTGVTGAVATRGFRDTEGAVRAAPGARRLLAAAAAADVMVGAVVGHAHSRSSDAGGNASGFVGSAMAGTSGRGSVAEQDGVNVGAGSVPSA